MREKIIPVILCGGIGSRLWPLSRASFPKQFLKIGQHNTKTLLQNTFARIDKLENLDDPIIVCNEDHRFIVAEQFREIGIKPKSILLEPYRRGTAPAIALAALKAKEEGKDPFLLVLSSDHEIKKSENFLNSIRSGIKEVEKGRLVTFGVVPNSPETGYGYIQAKNNLDPVSLKGSEIKNFFEKPDIELAKKFIVDNSFTWNSGIFLFKTNDIINQIKKYSPEIIKYCENSLAKSKFDLDFQRIDKDFFSKCEDVSIDIAVMEKTNLGTVIPLDAGWNDIGSWKKVWENSKKDIQNNSLEGNVFIKNTQDSLLKSENRLLVAIGIKNLVIIETSDAILVADKDSSQEVKQVVKDLDQLKLSDGKEHKKIFRPWGNYISIAEDNTWKVKKITVKPNQSLSLQMHEHRAEHWIIVSGTAKVEIDQNIKILEANQSAYIPPRSKHRLSNNGDSHLVLIEVQSGNYLEEDDIFRFEDIYGRINRD